MVSLCPHCGFDLKRDEIMEIDGFQIDPRGFASYKGCDLNFSPGEARLFHSIAKSGGRFVKASVLGERISDGECPGNVVAVYVHRIRKELLRLKIPNPINSKKGGGGGIRWVIPTTPTS